MTGWEQDMFRSIHNLTEEILKEQRRIRWLLDKAAHGDGWEDVSRNKFEKEKPE